MRVEVDIEGAERIMHLLHRLPYETVSRRGGPVRLAMARGARLLRNQARANFATSVAAIGKMGVNYSTGFTAKQIISKRGRIRDGSHGERFLVTVKPLPHPNSHVIGKNGRIIQANDLAFIMEYGSSNQTAQPWLRPAFEQKSEEVIHFVTTDLLRELEKIVTRLGAGL